MKSDPFAPADNARHAKNITSAALLGEDGPKRNRFAELLELHLTDHEQQANVSPSVEETERRQTLVDEYREQLAAEGPDAEAPTLEDETGALYVWREGDRVDDVHPDDDDGQPDGTTASGWHFIGEPEQQDAPQAPPRNGPGSSTEAWREYAGKVSAADPSRWATMSRDEIIHALEGDDLIPSEHA